MSTPRLATALWIHTRAPMAKIRSALEPLPVVSEPTRNGFVHVLYDELRWPSQDAPEPLKAVRELLDQAGLDYVPAIGPEVRPASPKLAK